MTGFPHGGRSPVALLCAACLLSGSLGGASRASAAEVWETWPRKADPGLGRVPAPPLPPAAEPKPRMTDPKPLPERAVEPGSVQLPAMDAARAAAAGDAEARKEETGFSYRTAGWILLGIAVAVGIAAAAGGGGGGDGGGVVVNPGHQ